MRKHIVIIEDDVAILSLIGHMMEGMGHRATKLNALFNFESLVDLHADCFILDERLPYVNGHIICIMLKSNPATKNIPVILISSHDGLEGFANHCKANAFLKKPFTQAALGQMVSGLLSPAVKEYA